jgi:hypothetical protein
MKSITKLAALASFEPNGPHDIAAETDLARRMAEAMRRNGAPDEEIEYFIKAHRTTVLLLCNLMQTYHQWTSWIPLRVGTKLLSISDISDRIDVNGGQR